MGVDRGLIEAHFEDIRNHIRLLRGAVAAGREAFLADPYHVYAVRYLLLVSIEATIHVAAHLIAASGWRTPKSAAESFDVLHREGAVKSPELKDRLVKMVGFRNLTVHRYWEIDDRRVYDLVVDNLGDLELLMRDVLEFLGPEPQGG